MRWWLLSQMPGIVFHLPALRVVDLWTLCNIYRLCLMDCICTDYCQVSLVSVFVLNLSMLSPCNTLLFLGPPPLSHCFLLPFVLSLCSLTHTKNENPASLCNDECSRNRPSFHPFRPRTLPSAFSSIQLKRGLCMMLTSAEIHTFVPVSGPVA